MALIDMIIMITSINVTGPLIDGIHLYNHRARMPSERAETPTHRARMASGWQTVCGSRLDVGSAGRTILRSILDVSLDPSPFELFHLQSVTKIVLLVEYFLHIGCSHFPTPGFRRFPIMRQSEPLQPIFETWGERRPHSSSLLIESEIGINPFSNEEEHIRKTG